MIDALGRDIDHLRISVTDRCNLDCFYCHHEGNDKGPEMGTERIKEIISQAEERGVRSVKITGGEPLLRPDICEIISSCKADVSVTTNGTLLEGMAHELAKAGLRRINIGCDSLTGSLPKCMEKVRAGIMAAKDAGIDVKINMVALRGMNDQEIPAMLDFCRQNLVNLQLIELIDTGDGTYEKHHMPLDIIEKGIADEADSMIVRKMQGRRRYKLGGMFVEFVTPDEDFCRACNKLRVTSTGKVKPCLMKQALCDTMEIALTERDSYGYGRRQ